MDVILDVNFRSSCRSARAFLLQPRGGWLLRSAWHNNENSDTENMSIFHCAHSKGLEFSAICLDVTVDVITSRSRAICMDVSLDVNFRGPALPLAPLLRPLSMIASHRACERPIRRIQTLFLILSKQKIFRYFMHMRAKTICGF